MLESIGLREFAQIAHCFTADYDTNGFGLVRESLGSFAKPVK